MDEEVSSTMKSATGRRGKLTIFTVLCQRRSPEHFKFLREQKIERRLQELRNWVDDGSLRGFDETAERRHLESREWRYHRLDDLVGFAEIYWDHGHRFQVNWWFQPDGRTKWGRIRDDRVSGGKRRFYSNGAGIEVAGFRSRGSTIQEKRKALHRALDYVEERSRALGFYVDLRCEKTITDHLDLDRLCGQTDMAESCMKVAIPLETNEGSSF